MRRESCFALLLFATVITGCSWTKGPAAVFTQLDEIGLEPERNDGVRLVTQGYALPTLAGVYLFVDAAAAERLDFRGGLDLVQMDNFATNVAGTGTCVEASGRFIAFGQDNVGVGYLRSTVGLIELEGIRAIPCH